MERNNNHSPLDEIMRLTKEAKSSSEHKSVPNPARPSQLRPAQSQNRRPSMPSKQSAQRPIQPRTVSAPGQTQQPQRRTVPSPQTTAFIPIVQQPAQKKDSFSDTYIGEVVKPRAVQSPREVPKPTEDQGIDVPAFANNRSNINSQAQMLKKQRAKERLDRYRNGEEKTKVIDYSQLGPEFSSKLQGEKKQKTGNTEYSIPTVSKQQSNVIDKNAVNTLSDTENKKPSKKSAKYESEMETEFEETVGKGVVSGSVKAIIYIISVLAISICLSLVIIFVGNDCFAFVKNDSEKTVTIPENAELDDIAKVLSDNDIINYPAMFKLYVNIRDKDVGNKFLSGEHIVNSNMSYDKLIDAFLPYATRQEITLTFVEGSTTDEIIDKLVSSGIGSREKYVEVINNYEYDLWFVSALDPAKVAQRKYRLDGYLFPDTYNFFTDSKEEDVIYKFLSNFDAKFSEENIAYCTEIGMTPDDIVTLASMIQKEAKFVTDYPYVSSVFYNRLNSNKTNGKLESNATVQYSMPKEEVEVKLTYDQIQKYDTGYNTFLYEGLPVGPICNPSLNAINFALYPADTDYYYFVSDAEGYNKYATSYDEHNRNVAEVEAAEG